MIWGKKSLSVFQKTINHKSAQSKRFFIHSGRQKWLQARLVELWFLTFCVSCLAFKLGLLGIPIRIRWPDSKSGNEIKCQLNDASDCDDEIRFWFSPILINNPFDWNQDIFDQNWAIFDYNKSFLIKFQLKEDFFGKNVEKFWIKSSHFWSNFNWKRTCLVKMLIIFV